jgi:outer membrane lipoprotein LolB
MKLRRACLVLCTLGLVACATPRPPSNVAFWSGRLALQVQSEPVQQWFANFELQGSAETGELLLLTPIGTSLAKLSWTPDSAQLEQGGRTLQGNSLAQLSERLSGTTLPVAALFDWLAGKPADAPGWRADLSSHAQGRLSAQRSSPAPAATLRIVLEQ